MIKDKYKKVEMNSYKGHYIKINDNYEYQKYYMPVISINEIGDICFNLDGISLEFFVSKSTFLANCNFKSLLNYDVEIYDAKDSTIDIYEKNMKEDLLIKRLEEWERDLIGITINCQTKIKEDIINIFENIIDILGIGSDF